MAKKRLLPFWMVPAHWGLSGKAKEIAKAYYYNDDYEADLKVAELTYLTEYEVDVAQLDIKKKYGVVDTLKYLIEQAAVELKYSKITREEYDLKVLDAKLSTDTITQKEYDMEVIELMPEGDDKRLKAIEYAYKYDEITQQEYSKEIYTLRKEPWIDLDVILNPDTNEVEFVFDYNEYFWKKLKAEGHPGTDEEEIIDNFVRDLGRKLATDDYSDNEDAKLVSANAGLENLPGLPEGFKSYK
ncbi:hypothetical protein FOI42_RS01930 [Escherichia coli]|nr:hypothetical protein [Escherichia coli]EFL4883614.1 hypothetical protein [Escherichia coli]